MGLLDEVEHAVAFGDGAEAARATRAAEAQWREHGFGPWAIRDRCDSRYIGGENEPSHRLAAKLGFTVRGPGRGRSGEATTVYELRR